MSVLSRETQGTFKNQQICTYRLQQMKAESLHLKLELIRLRLQPEPGPGAGAGAVSITQTPGSENVKH